MRHELILDFNNAVLELNEQLHGSSPLKYRLLPDRRLKRYTNFGIGQSTVIVELAEFIASLNKKMGDTSEMVILDAGGFLGDATALFSQNFRLTLYVEGDPFVYVQAKNRLVKLSSMGFADLQKVKMYNENYFCPPIKFDVDIVYCYHDQFIDTTGFLYRFSRKFELESKEKGILVLRNCMESRSIIPVITCLIFREDLSGNGFNVFQK